MKKGIVLLLALALESTLVNLPVVFLSLLILSSKVSSRVLIFALSFLFGIFLDLLKVQKIGLTSIFIVSFFFLLFSYERKFEISTKQFVLLSSFLGSFAMSIIFGYQHVIEAAFASVLVAFFLLKIL